MCLSSPSIPAPPPVPEEPEAAPTRVTDEVRTARDRESRRTRAMAGRASTIRNRGGQAGVLTPTDTTAAFQLATA